MIITTYLQSYILHLLVISMTLMIRNAWHVPWLIIASVYFGWLFNNAKFIFASTCGVEDLTDDYCVYKKFFEQYIQAMTDNHLIYRIPRVYGRGRKKGLMKSLRDDDVPIGDYHKEVEYIDIQDFREWFLSGINNTGILEYDRPKKLNTIREIKTVYVE